MPLLTAFLGMAIIDLLRCNIRKRYGHVRDLEFTGDFYDNIDEDFIDDFDVRTMANLIGKPLSDGRLRYWSNHQPSLRTAPSEAAKHVVCITGKDGSILHPRKQGKEDAKIRARRQSCFICRQYMLRTVNTQRKCCKCGMPLFQVDRSDGIAQRPYSCIYEHLSSQDEYIGCKLMKRNCFILPDHLRKFSMTR